MDDDKRRGGHPAEQGRPDGEPDRREADRHDRDDQSGARRAPKEAPDQVPGREYPL